ncbi:MAG: DNA polymerase III subunit gamma/tau [Lachnospiraceae bacterium]|nr:DNA polymerase III subunit gamma/tau [Lachnospiraceae bacterium]MCR5086422.1 DNA polymerase III subunit gamma/tau [Lachnospiraceae bacterium]
MAYIALYRKFRPSTFDEVKGQDAVVTTLRNQLRTGRIGHAYCFNGTRGTGKTSVAKLFAKAINCENPVDGNPCNECAMCKAINAGSSMNVVELDAASNNGVANIREIVDEVRYYPTEGKYKVYIIDEVHMLSTGAFNALLKTLEEPPSYVVFILATTEVHAIPITILSRCQRYDFRRIRLETIADRLLELCGREEIPTEEKAMRYIAKLADGSMRDALSLLERCVSYHAGRELTYDRILEVLGTVDVETFAQTLRYIHDGRVTEVLSLLDRMTVAGRELSRFVVDLTWYIRNLILAQSGEDLSDALEMSGEQMKLLSHEARVYQTEELMRYVSVLCELTNRLRFESQKRVLIEMSMIRLCRPQTDVNSDAVLDRIRRLEQELTELRRTGVSIAPEEEVVAEAPEEALPQALPEDLQAVLDNWESIIRPLTQPMYMCVQNCRKSIGEGGRLLLLMRSEVDYGVMTTLGRTEQLEGVIEKTIHRAVKVEVKLLKQGDSTKRYVDLDEINRRLKKMKIQEESE